MKANLHGFKPIAILLFVFAACSAAQANTELWIGVSGTSITTNWSDNANWSNLTGGGTPGPNGNDVIFGDNGAVFGSAGTINSVVDTLGLNPLSLAFTNQSQSPSFLFHTVMIPPGIGMTNANALTVGGKTIDGYVTTVAMTGGGTFVQNGGAIKVGNAGSASQTENATLDLTGLSTFVCNASAGTMIVAGSGADARGGGTLNLAGSSNNITIGTINFNTGSGNSSSVQSFIQLGSGTNILNVGTFIVVGTKASNGKFQYIGGAPATAGLRLRGVNGNVDDNSRATITVGDRNNTGTGNSTGTIDLNGHPVDAKIGTLTIGQDRSGATVAVHGGVGTVQFDTGTVDATTVNLAVCSTSDGSAAATGTLTVGAGGTLIVGSGGMSLANRNAGTATGNFNISGGNVICSNNIIKTTATASAAHITMTGGSLSLAPGKSVGTPAIPIDDLTMTSATLNLSVANNFTNIVVTTLNLVDALNTNNIATLPSIGSFPTQFPLISYVSSIGGGTLELGTLPGGFSGYISNDLVNTIWLVVTNGPFIAKTDQWGGGVNNLWDTSTLNWTNADIAVNYNEGDFVVFGDAASANNVSLTGTRLPTSLLVSNNILNYTFLGAGSIGGPVTLVKDGTASLTLTETGGDNFSGGITVNNGTLVLDNSGSAISGGLLVASGGTAQIGNNSANGVLPAGSITVDGALIFKRSTDLSVGIVIPGSGSLVKAGSARLALTAANTYTGVTTVTNGTLALTNAGTIAASSQVNVTGATLDVSGASGSTTLNALNLANATVTLAMPGVATPVNVTGLNMGGAGNTINVSALPPIPSYPVTLTLIQSASPIVGFNATLGTLPAGSPPFSGSIALSGDQLAVRLTLTAGPVGIRPNMFWTGADLPNLNTNWSDGQNWFLPDAPTSVDNAIFNNTATVAASALTTPGGGSAAFDPANVNNIVDANFTISSLAYTNIADYHNTFIKSGRSLNLTNVLTLGAINAGDSVAHTGFVSISGTTASVSVNNPNANLQIWLGSGPGGVGGGGVTGSQATLDLSALDNFSATVSRLALGASVGNAVNRPSGILYLAKTNTITAGFQTANVHAGTTTAGAAITVADGNQNAGSASTLYLGQVNTISADTIGIGRQKGTGHLQFNPAYANIAPYPTLTLQGFSSSRVSDFSIADGAGNTGTTTFSADTDLSGGIVTASVDTMNVGRASSGGTGANPTTGTFTFDAGTLTANTVNIGLQPASSAKSGIGTVNVNSNSIIANNAHLIVSGNLSLATDVGGTGAPLTSGTLNINGGLVQAGNIVAGSGSSSTIALSGGTLIVGGKAGTPTAPLTALTLNGGTLQLSADGNAGAASLVATTINPNAPTTLNIGPIINVITPSTIPLISYVGTDPFSILTPGTLPPGYVGTLVDDTVNSLVSLQLTVVPPPSPTISSIVISGGNIIFSGTNNVGTAGGSYHVLTSTNAAAPIGSWSVLTTGTFDANGNFSVTTAIGGTGQRFYLLELP
jgi:autotransporter-associated beta strand protein